MSTAELQWYIDLRRDASLPHGGAGLGFGASSVAASSYFRLINTFAQAEPWWS